MQTLIIYADKDEPLARRVYADLLPLGVTPWARIFDVPPGLDRELAEMDQLETSGVVVALFSNAFTRDERLVEFAEAANALGSVVIPVIADLGVKVPDHLPQPIKLTRRYAEAIQSIAALVPEKGDPLKDIPAWQQGNAAYADAVYEEAVTAYEKMRGDLTATMLYSRAAAYNAVRKHEEALKDMDAALALETDKDHFYRNRGLAYAGLGQHENALKDDEQALKLNPNSPLNLSSYAMTLVSLGRYGEAKETLEKILATDPANLLYRYQLGYANVQEGDLQAALDAFDAVLEADPLNESAIIGRRMVLGRLGKHEEALADINKAIKKEPRKTGLYLTRSLVNFYLERYEEMVNDATTALRRGTKDTLAPSYFNRALGYWKLGEKEKASADFSSAIEFIAELNTEKGIRRHAESDQTAAVALEILAYQQTEEAAS